MPRHKERDKHLPPRMRKKGARFYYVACGKWTPLGDDYATALLQWRELEGLCEGAATVAQLLDNAIAVMTPELKASTLREFSRANNRLKKAFTGFAPSDVEPGHIAQYLETRSAKVTANREIAFFSSAWEIARRRRWISLPNPCAGVRRNKERRRKRTARPAEIRALLFDKGERRDCVEADAIELTLKTAMREADLLHMKKGQIEDEGIRVTPRKTDASTGEEQMFFWDAELRACVNRLLGRRRRIGSVFLVPVTRGKHAGRPYTAPSWFKVWRPYFKACGVEGLTWHDLRRTALKARERELGIGAAREMGGHSSVVTTEGYVRSAGTTEVAPVTISALIRESKHG